MAVRWDAVVDANRFWTEPQDSRARAPAHAEGSVNVEVWLFGRLLPPGLARPLALALAAPSTVRDVVAELGRRFGADLVAKVTLKSCRIFVDGVASDDLDAPLGPSAARIEMILLTGIEGG